ncbi:MAG: hypothetical protein ACM3ME_00225 [Chloroflexota bacterium]|nr:hypothetical protein [Lentimicrobium sp.]
MTHKLMHRRKWLIAPLILLAIAVFGFVTMHLWNYVMPAVFSLPAITFLQAICLLVLSRILFGGHFRGHRHTHMNQLRNKVASMTPEERENFFKTMHERYMHRC